MTEDTLAPILPKYQIRRIIDTKDTLFDAIGSDCYGQVVTGDAFQEVVDKAMSVIPKVSRAAVFTSMQHLAGAEMTTEAIEDLSWRLAGNIGRLKRGIAVLPWVGQPADEWVPMQILSVKKGTIAKRVRNREFKRKAAEFTYLIIAGSPAGKVVTKIQSLELCHFFRNHFGFSAFDRERYSRNATAHPSFPFVDPLEMVWMRVWGFIEPTMSRSGPMFNRLWGNVQTLNWNRGLLKRRARLSFQCPMNYDPVNVPCHNCEIGRDRCQAACHDTTYVRGSCEFCNTEVAWFNPDLPAQRDCVDCASKRILEFPRFAQ